MPSSLMIRYLVIFAPRPIATEGGYLQAVASEQKSTRSSSGRLHAGSTSHTPLQGLAFDKQAAVAGWRCGQQHGEICEPAMLLNPFCPLTTAKVLALKATILVLLTLLIKARVQIVAGSALGIALLLLQTLVFLAVSGGLVLAAGGAALVATQQRRPAAA